MVALGGDLSPENLLEAYRSGIFPWPITLENGGATGMGGVPMTWFSPTPRAILEFNRIHLSRSLKKTSRQSEEIHSFSIDQAFEQVIRACAEVPRPGQSGTWITEPMLEGYLELHRLGAAHSAEIWNGDELVGGIYGVDADGAFSAESMFHRKANASKLVLLHLVEHLKNRDLDWMDIQMMTPHLKALGAREISRDDYLEKLAATRALGLKLF